MRTGSWASAIRLLLPVVVLSLAAGAQTPIPGPNVNMVSGTSWPGGDPFLQRQNEPSLAVSTRNPLHLVAGANDYRTVDLPGLADKATADAWLGLFKSFDGGLTWRSTLLPGYPQDTSADGLASPIKGFQAGADPTVRAGTNGLFYYSGIAFNRGAKGLGKVFVARLIDNNNKESGDPIKYLGTAEVDNGTSGQFMDKPWIAVDIPRPGGLTCTISAAPALPQSFPAGNVYLVYSKFTGSNSTSTKIMLSRSRDCGATWSMPTKLSESNSINQGTTVAVDPLTGAVYVAWRRFKTSSETDAILIAKSVDFGLTFAKAKEVASIVPFDQSTTALGSGSLSFRTNSFPTMAISVDGFNTSRLHLAWTARVAPGGDARIVMTTSPDGNAWSAPQLVDLNPSRGHQLMPALTFAGGKLALVFYDLRDDHTIGVYTPLGGGQYSETREWVGTDSPAAVFGAYVDDAGLTRRHTMDVRAALADPGTAPGFSPSVKVSQYKFGSRPGSTKIEQLQVNPPNLPMFSKGTAPFMGDYVDVAAVPFLPKTGGGWRFNTAVSDPAVFHTTWTDNRDVRPPHDGNWANYTPVASTGATSIYDSSQSSPLCTPGQSASRNQNIYTSRLTLGLFVGSLGNDKTLGTIQRGFVVLVQNTTNQVRSYRLTIVPPSVGQASFRQFFPPPAPAQPPLTTLDVTIAPRSSIARTVFVLSSNPSATVSVTVAEIAAPGGGLVSGGLQGSAVLNPDIENPDIANPDIANPLIANPDIANAEVYNPDIANPDIANPDIANPDIANPDIANPDIANPDIANPDIANPDIANPDIANPDIANPDIANPDIANPDIANGSLTDATWTMTNTGNTSASFSAKLFLKGNVVACTPGCGTTNQPACTPGCLKFQLLLHRRYKTPVAQPQCGPSGCIPGCVLQVETQNALVANVTNPAFTNASNLANPDIANPDIANATLALPPGESGQITLRVVDPNQPKPSGTQSATALTSFAPLRAEGAFGVLVSRSPDFAAASTFDLTSSVTSVVGAQGVNTLDEQQGNTQPPVTLTVTTTALPDGVVGQQYSQSLQGIGGVGARTWSLAQGSALPPGLTLSADGVINGTPATAGLYYSFVVQVMDSPVPPNPKHTATQNLTIRIADPLVITPDPLPNAVLGTSYSAALNATGGIGLRTWGLVSGALPSGLTLNAATGLISGLAGAPDTFQFTVKVTDSSCLALPCSTHQTATRSISTQVTLPPLSINAFAAFQSGYPADTVLKSGESVTVKITVYNAGSATVAAVTPTALSVSNSGTAAVAGCQPASATSADIPGGGSQDYVYTCQPVSGDGTLTFSAGVNVVTAFGTFVVISPSVSNSVTIDNTPPTISASATAGGNAYNSGTWTNHDVTVSFSCADGAGGSGVATVTGPVTLTAEGANQSVIGTCTDLAGNSASATFTGINIDKTPPAVTTTPDRTPDSNGWYNHAVTVAFSGSDSLSGIDSSSCTAPVTYSGPDTGSGSLNGSCRDLAGNVGTATFNFKYDATPPTATITAARPPDSNGWYNHAIGVSYNWSDSTSGVSASSCATSATYSGPDSATASVAATCSDQAGNVGTATFSLRYDATPPIITAALDKNPASTGWYNLLTGAPTASFTCADATSGLAGSCPGSVTLGDGVNQSLSRTVSDVAGNSASASLSGINVDRTPPTIGITAPVEGASYILNASVAAAYSCADALSGILACSGPVTGGANFNTATVGLNNFVVNATDAAGNQAQDVHTYRVNYLFVGFLSPLAADGMFSGVGNLGNAIPIKWQLQDALGAFPTDLGSVVTLKSVFTGAPPESGVCPISSVGQPFVLYQPQSGATGGSTFRYNSTGNQFIFNWDTSTGLTTGPGCYSIVLELNDKSALKSTSIRMR